MQETDKNMVCNVKIDENLGIVTYSKNITIRTGKKSSRYELILQFITQSTDVYLNLPYYFDLHFTIKEGVLFTMSSVLSGNSAIINLKNKKLTRSDIEGIICILKYDGLLSKTLMNEKINYDIIIQHFTQILSKIKAKQLRLVKSRVMGV